MKAYKVFNSDWACNGFQYEIGKTYSLKKGEILRICETGFHACEKLVDCFNYYSFNPENKAAEVLILGDVEKNNDKLATNKIKILNEISWGDVLILVNSGNRNSGYGNSGYGNSGDGNSGYGNSGMFNSDDPKIFRVFGKNLSAKKYNKIVLPNFCFFELTCFISHDTATQEEKEKHKT